MTRSVTMVKTGDYNPHFFDYPGLYLYLQAAVVVARFLAGVTAGRWTSLSQVSDYDFYLWGRAVTAAFGTATVFLVYLAGQRWSRAHGLVAAALMTVIPIHVRESHFVLTDVPMTFFVTLTLVLALRAYEKGTLGAFAWAGVAAGLAAGTKYTAWVVVSLPIIAAVMAAQPPHTRLRHALVAIGAFYGAYFLVAPYTLLDLPGFLNGFGALAAGVPWRPARAEPGSLLYLKHLRNVFGPFGLVLTGVGIAVFVGRLVVGPHRARFVMVLVFVPVFFSLLVDRTLVYARYLMPLVPFLCLLAAEAVAVGFALLRRLPLRRAVGLALAAALVVALLAQPAITSVGFNRNMGLVSTYMLVSEWVEGHGRPGARIIHEAESLHLPPGHFEVEYVHSLVDHPAEYDLTGNYDYVIATSATYGKVFGYPTHYAAEHLAYDNLFRRLAPACTISPSAEHPGPEVKIFTVPR